MICASIIAKKSGSDVGGLGKEMLPPLGRTDFARREMILDDVRDRRERAPIFVLDDDFAKHYS